jgi:hypothetical protein
MSELNVQVDGDHYNKMKMQTIKLVYKLNASPCFCKLAKYLTREKGDKLINLNKARHCIELERDLVSKGEGNYDFIERGDPSKVICEFTENEHIQNALILMYDRYYEDAIFYVNEIISEYKGSA